VFPARMLQSDARLSPVTECRLEAFQTETPQPTSDIHDGAL
jgi:hypothetical protein